MSIQTESLVFHLPSFAGKQKTTTKPSTQKKKLNLTPFLGGAMSFQISQPPLLLPPRARGAGASA
jgi:hypothetical protein